MARAGQVVGFALCHVTVAGSRHANPDRTVSGVNPEHRCACASDEWRAMVRDVILPWALADTDLGDDVIEVGPGYGATTDVLRERVAHLTAIEIDPELAAGLSDRLTGTNVDVVEGDATAIGFEDNRFSGATCFSMLHHVPSPALQDRLIGEVARVLRPGGVLVASDSLDSPDLRTFHHDDTFVPVDPDDLPRRLRGRRFRRHRDTPERVCLDHGGSMQLDHLILPVNDRDASVAFYTELCGFDAEGESGPFSVVRVTPDLTMQLAPWGTTGGYHLAFAMPAAEFDATFARFRQAGIAVRRLLPRCRQHAWPRR